MLVSSAGPFRVWCEVRPGRPGGPAWTLQRSPGDCREESSEEEARGPASGRRILVVDDHRDSADSLADLLALLGYRVDVAYDGRLGLEEAIGSRLDVAVLDIGLPRVDGYALARRLRARPGGEGLLLIALTGWAGEEHQRLAREAGFDHFLIKPVSMEALVAAIESVVDDAG